MSVNKFMHPRNVYKNPPNFKELADTFEDFKVVCKKDVTGKVNIDFKDPESLRILTKCLLKRDFNVDIEIPSDRLVPTLPLRLNYILWIEDLIKTLLKEDIVNGLDIGTGACAIYPVLGAVKNKWRMMGTETDEQSMKQAQDNINKNNLQDLITVKQNKTETIIDHLLVNDDKLQFDFCMCNPPFYSSVEELCASRSTARPPPKNAFTGSPQELITKGGELEFIRNLINESNNHKNRISLFTTMVGHKYNLKELLEDLKEKKITFTHTEFCQGRVTRWGLAWTFGNYAIYNLVPPREKLVKKLTPMTFVLSTLTHQTNADKVPNTAHNRIKTLLKELNIMHNIINKRNNVVSIKFKAYQNTWSSQRKKRRIIKRQEETSKRQKTDHDTTESTSNSSDAAICDLNKELQKPIGPILPNSDVNSNVSTQGNEGSSSKLNFIVEGIMKVIETESEIKVVMEYLDGNGGKEAMHQIFQYIKNNWK